MSGGIEITSNRPKKPGEVALCSPLDVLMKIEFFKRTFAEIETDLRESDTRRDPENRGGRDYIAVFIDISVQAQGIIKAVYERQGWVVDCSEPKVIKFYFYK